MKTIVKFGSLLKSLDFLNGTNLKKDWLIPVFFYLVFPFHPFSSFDIEFYCIRTNIYRKTIKTC